MGSAMGAGNMYGGGGGSSMSCHKAAVAMSPVTLMTEACCEVMGSASEVRALRKGMTLQACQRATQGMSFGSTDCAKSMTWAMAQKKAFDVFVVYAAAPWW